MLHSGRSAREQEARRAPVISSYIFASWAALSPFDEERRLEASVTNGRLVPPAWGTDVKGELGNGHDARVSRIEIREARVEISFGHVEPYVPEAPQLYGVWACTAQLVFEAPEAVAASWHRMSLWVLDSELRVSDVIHGWEILLERQENVSFALEWSNGAKFSVTNAKSALLHLAPIRRTGEVRDEGEPR